MVVRCESVGGYRRTRLRSAASPNLGLRYVSGHNQYAQEELRRTSSAVTLAIPFANIVTAYRASTTQLPTQRTKRHTHHDREQVVHALAQKRRRTLRAVRAVVVARPARSIAPIYAPVSLPSPVHHHTTQKELYSQDKQVSDSVCSRVEDIERIDVVSERPRKHRVPRFLGAEREHSVLRLCCVGRGLQERHERIERRRCISSIVVSSSSSSIFVRRRASMRRSSGIWCHLSCTDRQCV